MFLHPILRRRIFSSGIVCLSSSVVYMYVYVCMCVCVKLGVLCVFLSVIFVVFMQDVHRVDLTSQAIRN